MQRRQVIKTGAATAVAAISPGLARAQQGDGTGGQTPVPLAQRMQDAILPAFEHAKENSRLVALVSGDPEKALGDAMRALAFATDADVNDEFAHELAEFRFVH